MAWSLLSLRRIRSQTLTRASPFRLLSSDSGLDSKTIISSDPFANSFVSESGLVDSKAISSSDLFVKSFKSQLSGSSPVDISFDTINDSFKLPASDTGLLKYKKIDPFANVELIRDDIFRAAETVETGSYMLIENPDVHYTVFAVDSTEAFVKHVIRCEEWTGIVYKAFKVISTHSIFDTCSTDAKLKILSTVFDRIRNYPQADPLEVFLMNRYLKSMYDNEDGKKDLTKVEVLSRVLDVIKCYPKVAHHKVTEETNIYDLGLLKSDYCILEKALYLEFKLGVQFWNVTPSCKLLSDYFYENRMKRMDFEIFREHNIIGHVFWPGALLLCDDAIALPN